MEKILEVKGLKISFRTNNGNVQAVRDISFDLLKGETLGIVGESGSGKSVTARAVLGILAGNKIVEGGELFFEGQDLLKISESGFYDIRGSKISMIFQDPLSSLNPIMRIGKQITEAMILKSKTSRKVGKKNIKFYKKTLIKNLEHLTSEDLDEFKYLNKNYYKIILKSETLALDYERARINLDRAQAILSDIIKLVKTQGSNIEVITSTFNRFVKKNNRGINEYLVKKDDVVFENILEIKTLLSKYSNKKIEFAEFNAELSSMLSLIDEKIKSVLSKEKPDFLSIVVKEDESIEDFNLLCDKYYNFVKTSVQKSREHSIVNKKLLLEYLMENKEIFEADFNKSTLNKFIKGLKKKVSEAADNLSPGKDKFIKVLVSQLDAHSREYYENKHSKKKKLEEAILVEKFTKINDLYAKLIDSVNENITKDINLDEIVKQLDLDYKEHVSDFLNVVTRFEAKQNALDLMTEVGIKEAEKRYKQYPFQFSGGMRQRIVIAIAISFNPDILICDEPTTALDVTIQSQILELINKIKHERDLSVIFITHDLGVIANMADRIAVMYAGKIVEKGNVDEIFYNPKHPYTWALLSSMPDLMTKEKLESIPGTPPNMIHPPKGDAFAARSKYAMKIDFEEEPPMFKVSDTHYAATWLLHPDAPQVQKPKIVTERIERAKQQLGVTIDGE